MQTLDMNTSMPLLYIKRQDNNNNNNNSNNK